MTIDEALKSLIYKHNFHERIRVNKQTVRTWQKRFEEGKLSPEQMKKILIKAGMVIVQPEMWSEPPAPIKKTSKATIKELNDGILKGGINRKLAGEK